MLGNKVSGEALMNRLVVYVMMFSFKDVFMEFYYPLEVAINELKDYVKGQILESMRELVQKVKEDKLKEEIRKIVYGDYGISSFPRFCDSTYGKIVLKTYRLLEMLTRGRGNLEKALKRINDLSKRPEELRNFIAHGHKDEVDLTVKRLLEWGFTPFWVPYLEYYLPRIIVFLNEYRRDEESFRKKIAERILGDEDVLNSVVEYKKQEGEKQKCS